LPAWLAPNLELAEPANAENGCAGLAAEVGEEVRRLNVVNDRVRIEVIGNVVTADSHCPELAVEAEFPLNVQIEPASKRKRTNDTPASASPKSQ
jgi:hypothetical protein